MSKKTSSKKNNTNKQNVSPIESHKGQLEVWNDPARFKTIVAGRRWGKTILALEWLLQGSCVPKSINCYVAPTREQGKEIAWEYLKERCRQLKWFILKNESSLIITRRSGARIYIRSAEVPARFRGKKYHRIVLDEYAEYKNEELWNQAIRPALSDTRGKAIFIFTPRGLNHAYDLFQNSLTLPDWKAFKFKTIDSPFFQTEAGKKEIEDAKRNLTERDFKQEYEASFENFAGRIYYAYDRVLHNTDYNYDPQNGAIIIGQDFNRSPMSSCFFQKVAGKLIQFGELFIKAADTRTTCTEIKHRFPNAEIIFRPDATGARRTTNSSLSDFEIIKQFGFAIDVNTINPRIVDRYMAVNRAFEKGQVLINANKCPHTIKDREILSYKLGTGLPNLNDPMAGHISDAGDYAIVREFPFKIVQHIRSTTFV